MSAERAVEFETAWCATDLGDHRSCASTYEDYPYDSLPPLDSARFTGAFEWLGGTTAPAPERAAILDRLATDLAARGSTLPQDFAAFHTDAAFHRSLDEVSVTGCWTHLSGPIPSPVEPGAFLVRFLRDQQDCVIWYLYLRASGEAFVSTAHSTWTNRTRWTVNSPHSSGAPPPSRSSPTASGSRTGCGSRSTTANQLRSSRNCVTT